MRIERTIIVGVGPLQEERHLLGEPGAPWASACLRGPNGAGKTTWLEVVHALWVWFARCCRKRGYVLPSSPLLKESRCAAMLLDDLPGPRRRLWIAYGAVEALREYIGDELENVISLSEKPRWDAELLSWWDQAIEVAQTGGPSLPNVVLLEAQGRYIPAFSIEKLERVSRSPPWLPAPRYTPGEAGTDPVEGILRTLKLARPKEWARLREVVGDVLPGIVLEDEFDLASRRPLFRVGGKPVFLDRLSAGESALLVSLVTILRWASPGAVVLLDEPELHQHLSLMRGSLAAIEWLVVDEGKGQLIVASHAPEVWSHFRARQAWVELEARR